MLSSRALLWAFSIAVAFAASNPVLAGADIVPVKGTITLKGKPLASGRIFFHFENDQFLGAKIKDGTFAVKRVPVGRYRVSIEGKGVGPRYASEETTPIVVEVIKTAPAGAYDIRLD
jgi:hypothetical protein